MRAVAILVAMVAATVADAATVIISSTPTKAEVFMGDLSFGTTPCRMKLGAGKYNITLKHGTSKDLKHEFTVGKKLIVLRLIMTPQDHPVDLTFSDLAQEGWDVFSSKPTRYLGSAPCTMMLPKGKHSVVAVKDGFKDIKMSITVEGKEDQSVEVANVQKGKSSIRRVKHLRYLGRWKCGQDVLIITPTKFECYWRGHLRFNNPWSFKWPNTITVQTAKKLLYVLREDDDGNLVGQKGAEAKQTFKREEGGSP